METIPKADCTQIGFIRKTHGVRGELTLEFEPEFELSVEEATQLFLEIDGLLVPFFIAEDGLRFKSSKSAIVKLEWVETEEYARRLVGCPVYLFSEEIVPDEVELTYSVFENYMLEDKILGTVGKIIHVDDFSGNIVFTVQQENNEILVPFNEDLLVSIDEQKQIIKLTLPEGLIDL